jgi:hypothetical protein
LFRQNYSEVSPEDAILEGDTWLVVVTIGLGTKMFRKARIDVNNGKIVGYV